MLATHDLWTTLRLQIVNKSNGIGKFSMDYTRFLNTYSIVAFDHATQQLGVAVQTHQVSVGRMVPFILPGIGAVATQSLVNISYGPMALSMLHEGVAASDVINGLIATDSEHNRRQVAIVDSQGNVGAYTGDGCIPHAGHKIGDGYSVQANMMTNDTVIPAMAEAYETSKGSLAHRMMAALVAAQNEDGDIRGQQSAALYVIGNDRTISHWDYDYNLRIDESDQPLTDMQRLVDYQHAKFVSQAGNERLADGDVDGALKLWRDARDIAPDDEELAFWQGVTLADKNPTHNAVSVAARIIEQAIRQDDRFEHWVELILRLETVGIIERTGAGQELLVELKQM